MRYAVKSITDERSAPDHRRNYHRLVGKRVQGVNALGGRARRNPKRYRASRSLAGKNLLRLAHGSLGFRVAAQQVSRAPCNTAVATTIENSQRRHVSVLSLACCSPEPHAACLDPCCMNLASHIHEPDALRFAAGDGLPL